MKSLPSKSILALAQHSVDADGLFDELIALQDKFTEDAAELIGKINDVKSEAAQIMEEAASDAEEYYDERSERWQESDTGSYYSEWKNRLREVADVLNQDVEVPEVQMPDRPQWVNDLADPDFSEVSQ